MRLILETHALEQASARGVDMSMLLFLDGLKEELKNLLKGQKLIKTEKGTTLVFKKSNSSETVYLKTAWGKKPPFNNKDYQGATHDR